MPMTTGTRNDCAIFATAIAAQVAIRTSVISVSERSGEASSSVCAAGTLRGTRAAFSGAMSRPQLSSTAKRSGGNPRGFAGGEVRQYVADPMEFACFVEKEIRAEREAAVAILR